MDRSAPTKEDIIKFIELVFDEKYSAYFGFIFSLMVGKETIDDFKRFMMEVPESIKVFFEMEEFEKNINTLKDRESDILNGEFGLSVHEDIFNTMMSNLKYTNELTTQKVSDLIYKYSKPKLTLLKK